MNIPKIIYDINEIKKKFQKSSKVLQQQSDKKYIEKNRKTSIDTTQKLLDTISNQSTIPLKDWLFTIKEVNIFYEKTHIPPQYIFYTLAIILSIIIINYFSKAFTLIVGVIYPVHCSIKVMAKYDWYDINYKKHKLKEEDEKKRKLILKKLQNWLEYWIVFFLLYNLETFFSSYLEKIPMYLFYKVVFLAVLFLPWYKGAHYIYRSHLREVFRAYEGILYHFFLLLWEKIKEWIFIDKSKEPDPSSSEEEEPIDTSPDEKDDSDSDSDSEDSNSDLKPKKDNSQNIKKTIINKGIDNKYFKNKEDNLKKNKYSKK